MSLACPENDCAGWGDRKEQVSKYIAIRAIPQTIVVKYDRTNERSGRAEKICWNVEICLVTSLSCIPADRSHCGSENSVASSPNKSDSFVPTLSECPRICPRPASAVGSWVTILVLSECLSEERTSVGVMDEQSG